MYDGTLQSHIFFLSLHKIISYLSLILRKRLDHEVIAARSFT